MKLILGAVIGVIGTLISGLAWIRWYFKDVFR